MRARRREDTQYDVAVAMGFVSRTTIAMPSMTTLFAVCVVNGALRFFGQKAKRDKQRRTEPSKTGAYRANHSRGSRLCDTSVARALNGQLACGRPISQYTQQRRRHAQSMTIIFHSSILLSASYLSENDVIRNTPPIIILNIKTTTVSRLIQFRSRARETHDRV